MPKEIVDKIDGVMKSMLSDPEARKVLLAQGLIPSPVSGAAFNALIAGDMKRYAEIKTRAGINVE